MKGKMYLSIAVSAIIGAQLSCSCEKIPKPDPPVILQPKVEMTVSPTGILPYGTICNVSWTSTNGKSITINNKSVGPVGSVADKLYKDTLYTIVVINENLSAKAEREIKVGDWTTSKFGQVSFYPWRYKEFRKTRDGVILSQWLPSVQEKEEIVFYYKSGDRKISTYPNNVEKWSINEDGTEIILNGEKLKCSISTAEMSIYQNTTYGGLPAIFECIYEHASNIPTDK